MDALDSIPARIKYYLLEYKDRNMEDYRSIYGTKKLRDLERDQLKSMFLSATTKDFNKI